jgi:DNA-directed RNA polymerase subunit E'/Rpb7
MEQTVVFEEKVYITPKDLWKLKEEPLDDLILKHLKQKLERRCSSHGYVIPNTLTILSHSMGQFEHGQFTGNVVYHAQAEGRVYNPANGTRMIGKVSKKNKMGLYVIYEDAIRILVPRDLHLGNEEFENLDVDDTIELELRKSRFQIQDPFILSVGVFLQRISEGMKPEQVEDDSAELAAIQTTNAMSEPSNQSSNQNNQNNRSLLSQEKLEESEDEDEDQDENEEEDDQFADLPELESEVL